MIRAAVQMSVPAYCALPAQHDVDANPHLLVVALTRAALLGVCRALDSAHLGLAAPEDDRRYAAPGSDELLANGILVAATALIDDLARYERAVLGVLADDDDPF